MPSVVERIRCLTETVYLEASFMSDSRHLDVIDGDIPLSAIHPPPLRDQGISTLRRKNIGLSDSTIEKVLRVPSPVT